MAIRDLLTGPYVAPDTRDALLARLEAPPIAASRFLTAAEFRCCRVLQCGW